MKKEYIEFIEEKLKLKILGKIKTSNDHHRIECLLCGEKIKATPKSKVSNFKKSGLAGCPKCTHHSRYEKNNIEKTEKIKNMGFTLLTPYNGKMKPITIINNNCSCGRSWTTKAERLLSGRSFCRPCNDERKRQRLIDFNEDKYQQSLAGKKGFDQYSHEVRVLTERTYREHKSFINPNNHIRALSGIDGAYHLDHIISIKYCFSNNIPVELCSHRDNLRIIPWKKNAIKWKRPSTCYPKIFWKYLNNYDEKIKFIKRLNNEIKGIKIYKKEEYDYNLDLINHDNNIGVLIHRFEDIFEQTVGTKKYLFNISEYFRDLGIRVIHVFEHEWIGKSDLIVKRIKHIVGENKTSKRIYARKCDIRIVSNKKDKSELLNNNHVQGNDNASLSFGAYYEDDLVAIMTFTKSRVFMKEKKTNKIKWELSRFATDTNYIVVGIASKLLNYFKQNYDWDEIYSFADLRWSDISNNVYETLGFKRKTHYSKSYHYIVDGEYKHRWNYQKAQLKKMFPDQYNHRLTEYQNMLEFGYDRVWDSGILKYTMQSK